MCFGNNSQTSSSTSTTTPAPYLTAAGQSNLNYATNLQSQGFTPYTGQQVADFAPQQTASFGQGTGIAGAVTPELNLVGGALNNYTTAGPSSVTPETISSQMSPYMNAYVGQALAPQVQNLNNEEALQSQLTQGQATSAGAFGDPRATMLQQNQNANSALQEEGLVGNAYTSAFNTAIGAGAQDVSNNLNAQTTNANLDETALNRELTGANTILGANTNSATLQNTLGAQQTEQSQADLNAAYNQYLMAQQYPFQTTQLVDSTLGAAQGVSPTTTTGTQSAPNNAGYGLVGSLLGAAGSAAGGYFSGAGSTALAAALMAADGGDVPSGTPTLVGERGPEVIVPKGDSNVIPYEKLKDAIAKKKGVRQTDGLARAFGVAA